MSINEFKEIIVNSNVELKGELAAEKTMAENGVDSLALTLISYELSDVTGREITLHTGQTPNQILDMVNS